MSETSDGTLFIGTRRYSSWSLRGWLAVRLAGLAVTEVVLPLDGSGASPAVRAHSASGKVPYLIHRGVHVWESLAIGEYCAEQKPALWPHEPAPRAWARAVAHEMHAGFRDLRIAMPMNLGADFTGAGRTPGALADIARIEALWRDTISRFGHGGPFLFGPNFTLADAMFAPIVARFLCFRPELTEASQAYCAAVRRHELVAEWFDAALAEPIEWRVAKWETPPA